MAKLGGSVAFGGGFKPIPRPPLKECLSPVKSNLKGGVADSQGGLQGKGVRSNDLQGNGGVAPKSASQADFSGSGAKQQMDGKGGKGVVGKSAGQVDVGGSGQGQKMRKFGEKGA